MLRYAALALALVPAMAAPAFAEPSAGEYQKRVLSVVELPGDVSAARLSAALAGEKRFLVVPTSATAGQSSAAMIALVAANAKKGGYASHPTYALIPHMSLGSFTTSLPEEERDEHGHVKRVGPDEEVTVSARLTCPLNFSVDIYDAASGRQIKTLQYGETLERKLEYHYTKHDSAAAIAIKAAELGVAIALELRRTPAEAFASQANDTLGTFAGRVRSDMRAMPEFRLAAVVTGWDGPSDRVFFNLGRDLGVHPDDWYRVNQDGRPIGVFRVRKLNDTTSEAQPLFLDANLRMGDQVEEYGKANVWHGLKAGALALTTGPVFAAGYGLQWDVAPAFDGSETYFTTDVGGLVAAGGGGFSLDLGLLKKNWNRRWAFSYGAKVGLMSLSSLTESAAVPTGTLATGVDCYLTPDIVWTNDIGLEALWPISTLAAPGTIRYPFGPVIRTGLSIAF